MQKDWAWTIQKAIADYDKAIELNPEYAGAYYNRGIAKRQLKQYKEAIADYDKAIKLNPKDANVYYNRGFAYRELGKKKKQMQILAHGQNSLERALKKLKKHQKQ